MTAAWYLRSGLDADTHHGELRGGLVMARCGARFTPRPLPLRQGAALPGYPPDPEQVCPECTKALAR